MWELLKKIKGHRNRNLLQLDKGTDGSRSIYVNGIFDQQRKGKRYTIWEEIFPWKRGEFIQLRNKISIEKFEKAVKGSEWPVMSYSC